MPSTLTLRSASGVQTAASWAAAGAPGPWLIVVPHDDDLVLGMGLCVQSALAAGIPIAVAIVSDGGMGYFDPAAQPALVARRWQEMVASCARLGIAQAQLHALGYPDGSLPQHQGARLVTGAATGIAYDLCRVLRTVRPGTVFGPTRADLHPDHRAVAAELAISCFHAGGEIWAELGTPLAAVPARFDYAVYCPFPGEPTLHLHSDAPSLATKLAALGCFTSQRQISSLVSAVQAGGPHEYLQRQTLAAYPPPAYRTWFATDGAGPGPVGAPAADTVATGASSAPGAGFDADCARVLPLLASWPERAWPPLVAAWRASPTRPLLLIGEGSSRLFPAGLARTIAAAAPQRLRLCDLGGRDAAALPLDGYQLLLVSNSGKSRELVELLGTLPRPVQALALVGVAGGALQRGVPAALVLLDAPERAVAATVSVLAQALAISHAACEAAGLTVPWAALRAALLQAEALTLPPPAAGCERIWWSGPESGPAGELALKTMETAGCLGVHLPGTMALHGIEEVLGAQDLVISLQADERDADRLRERITATGARLLTIGPRGELVLPDLGPWSGCAHLVAGWRLLAQLALARGRDADRPVRARKVGNEHLP